MYIYIIISYISLCSKHDNAICCHSPDAKTLISRKPTASLAQAGWPCPAPAEKIQV